MIKALCFLALLMANSVAAHNLTLTEGQALFQVKGPIATFKQDGPADIASDTLLASGEFDVGLYQESTQPSRSVYWYRIDILSEIDAEQRVHLVSGSHIIQHLDLYLYRGADLVASAKLGILDREPLQGLYRGINFTIDLKPLDELTLLVRKQNDGPGILPLSALKPTEFERLVNNQLLFWGIGIGIFAALVIYNALIYSFYPSKAYRWYLMFQVLAFLEFASIYGFGYVILAEEFVTVLAQHVSVLNIMLAWTAAMFAKEFLNTKEHLPRLYKFVDQYHLVLPVLAVFSLFVNEIVRMALSGIIIPVVAIGCVYFAYRGIENNFLPAKVYMYSWVSIFVGGLVGLLTYADLIPANVVTLHGFMIGAMLEIYLISIALAQKVKHQEMMERKLSFLEPILNMPNKNFYYHGLQHFIRSHRIAPDSLTAVLISQEGVDDLISALGSQTVLEAQAQLLKNVSLEIQQQSWLLQIEIPNGGVYSGISMSPERTLFFVKNEVEHADQVLLLLSVWQKNIKNSEYLVDLEVRSSSTTIDINFDGTTSVYRKAYSALIEARNQKKPWLMFDARIDHLAKERLEILHDLHYAIENDEIKVFIQPQVCLSSGQVVGGEALVRWKHRIKGMVSPGVFIPLAEQSGLIHKITQIVLEKVFVWMQVHDSPVHVSVNISVLDLHKEGFVEFLQRLIATHPVKISKITLEITESQSLETSNELLAVIAYVRQLGFKISIDDFGTGYSSMAYLSQINADEVKIDMMFVKNIDKNATNRNIVGALTSMATALNAHTVVEGIETAAELATIIDLGGDIGQGFYWSPAIEAEAFFQYCLERQPLESSI